MERQNKSSSVEAFGTRVRWMRLDGKESGAIGHVTCGAWVRVNMTTEEGWREINEHLS